jgi:hypothetical protein
MVKLLITRNDLGYPTAVIQERPPSGLGELGVWAAAFTGAGFKAGANGSWRRRLADGVVLVATLRPQGTGIMARIAVCSVYADDETRELCAFYCLTPDGFAGCLELPKRKRAK